ITRVMRVCCKAETYQLVSYRFVGPGGEVVFTRRIPGSKARVVKADPGVLMYRLIRTVCAPGFGED
ncbi:MAG: hypothetical protein KJ621_04430, partial [Proteobacteria bacterium]|nr:hypothetical protein [Pseudomonadota bacterium]